jgi:hypothetical protein
MNYTADSQGLKKLSLAGTAEGLKWNRFHPGKYAILA